MILVVGSYGKSTDRAIQLYRWEEAEQAFRQLDGITGIENPSYLDIDNERGLIYAITEKKEDGDAELHLYNFDDKEGTAELVACIPYQGSGSCYISCDSTRTHAFIANYGDGTLTVIKLPHEAVPGLVVQQIKFKGNGPVQERQDKSHIHAAVISKDERYLYVSDLGSDRLYQYAYHPGANFPLHPAAPNFLRLPPGSGPRHMAISPDGRRLYLLTELSGELFVINTQEFGYGPLQKVSMVAYGYTGKIEAADIQIDSLGAYLYASIRGDANEIVSYAIHPVSGRLKFIQRIGAAGVSPRSLLICEQQGLLLAANEQSNNISFFKLMGLGKLELMGKSLQVTAPACLKASTINTHYKK